MDPARLLDVVSTESERCLAALSAAEPTARVPTCPGWTAADLTWHLTEVQLFWAAIVAGALTKAEGVEEPLRPPDGKLLDLLAVASASLVAALSSRAPDESCWSWYDDGQHVGWVVRRQAHEALIHRVDAELTAGVEVADVEPEVAADGVDEMLGVMIGAAPTWGAFTADGTAVSIRPTDVERRWTLELGRFTGTSPETGRTYDEDAGRVRQDGGSATPALTGRAWDLDRWLWGRSGALLTISGAPSLTDRLRALATASTQ